MKIEPGDIVEYQGKHVKLGSWWFQTYHLDHVRDYDMI